MVNRVALRTTKLAAAAAAPAAAAAAAAAAVGGLGRHLLPGRPERGARRSGWPTFGGGFVGRSDRLKELLQSQ